MGEVSLRQIIEVIVKGKKTILITILVCVVISTILSFFILKPVYEAQVMLRISQASNDNIVSNITGDSATIASLLSAMSQRDQISIETYREQIKAPTMLQFIRKEMHMEHLTLEEIAENITVDNIKNTNLITINVTDENPETAAEIANRLSERFIEFITETNQKQAESSGQVLKAQMEKEKDHLDEASKKLEYFLSKPRGPSELMMELESKLTQLTEFKTKLTQIKIDENSVAASLAQGKKLLENTPKTLVTNVNLLDNDLLADAIRDKTGLKTNEIANLELSTEQVNDIFIYLSNRVNELEINLTNLRAQRENIEKSITECQKEIEKIQIEQAQKQREYDLLKQERDIIKQTYEAYQQKYKEAVIKQSIDTGRESIIVVSEALPPIEPIAPKKLLIFILSIVIGLLLGILITAVKEYWNSSEYSVAN